MRIWDINPGYLNRQSLLGEHRELHGIVAILVHNKKGYSRHPETRRWQGHGWALRQRHRLLVAEMALRGFCDRSPVLTRSNREIWPPTYLDPPHCQLQILARKYQGREQGRIPLPRNNQQLWSHHKYSVLARDEKLYRRLGPEVAALSPQHDMAELAGLLTEVLRHPPGPGGLRNALQHMWGHVAKKSALPPKNRVADWSPARLAGEIRQRALAQAEPYLLNSTALGELAAWLPGPIRARAGNSG
ncbi:MAG: hypothetical protein C0613_04600 [Desulfobulbaceae bacterium]|nr:MAG: hypothetical protein C0613_04600 [Desulfobulbaceae bacterium]